MPIREKFPREQLRTVLQQAIKYCFPVDEILDVLAGYWNNNIDDPALEDMICRYRRIYGSKTLKDHVHTHACAIVDQRKEERRVRNTETVIIIGNNSIGKDNYITRNINREIRHICIGLRKKERRA